ncbi:hypothetical protein [Vagococcus acidifermentans]|uniref:DUF5673 domain-containing protein n=1 Tax=Vagococcus acidifermentans TaxID=564710 RepID=A0A430AMT7_9ENTE|nr:hypothetical protein [Vagococcus acidifermentans]RSU09224.1 hypothetical protein CBF27_13070 [Vagococcus acidifermentans]
MAESLMIAVFLMMWIVLQVRKQRKIKLLAKRSWMKKIISIALAILLIVFFWSDILADQLKLITFVILILNLGFIKEGISESHLVKVGVLEGDLYKFKRIEIEELSNGTQFVSFYKNENNRLSMIFDTTQTELVSYFDQYDLLNLIVINVK